MQRSSSVNCIAFIAFDGHEAALYYLIYRCYHEVNSPYFCSLSIDLYT